MKAIIRTARADEDLIDIWLRIAGENPAAADRVLGVTTRKWRICPTFKNVSGTQVGLTVVVVAFSALRAS